MNGKNVHLFDPVRTSNAAFRFQAKWKLVKTLQLEWPQAKNNVRRDTDEQAPVFPRDIRPRH